MKFDYFARCSRMNGIIIELRIWCSIYQQNWMWNEEFNSASLPCLASTNFSSVYNHTVWRSVHTEILSLCMNSFRCCCTNCFKRSLFFSLRKVIIFPLHSIQRMKKWTAQLMEDIILCLFVFNWAVSIWYMTFV